MVLSAVIALSLLAAPQAETTLSRKFTMGERLSYQVRSSLQVDSREIGLKTAMPQDLDIQYDFTTEVRQMKADGIAVIAYKRPTMTIIEGETFDEPSRRIVERTNLDLLLTVSPINDIIDVKEVKPSARPAKWLIPARQQAVSLNRLLGEFVSEVHRLSLFVGSFDSALDFAPKLPLDPVKPGDTWQQTVGYQPQRTRGTKKNVVQRLDYTLTYKGRVTVNGKPFERVQAKLKLDTDLAEFVHQTFDAKSEDTGLKRIPLKLDATIDFDLDPATHRTVLAVANTQGSFQVWVNDVADEPVEEETMKGRTVMRLANVGRVPPPKK